MVFRAEYGRRGLGQLRGIADSILAVRRLGRRVVFGIRIRLS